MLEKVPMETALALWPTEREGLEEGAYLVMIQRDTFRLEGMATSSCPISMERVSLSHPLRVLL